MILLVKKRFFNSTILRHFLCLNHDCVQSSLPLRLPFYFWLQLTEKKWLGILLIHSTGHNLFVLKLTSNKRKSRNRDVSVENFTGLKCCCLLHLVGKLKLCQYIITKLELLLAATLTL